MTNREPGKPFASLLPERVLAAVEAAGVETDGRLFALNSYENRVYQIGVVSGSPLIAKFYRPHRWTDVAIREEHAFASELAAVDLAVAVPIERQGDTLLCHEGHRYALFPRLAARSVDLGTPMVFELLGRALGRLHAVGAVCRFQQRPALSVERLGWLARDALLQSPIIESSIDTALIDRYAEVSDMLLEKIEDAFERYGPWTSIRLHGDCHLGNILRSETGPVFVDLDDCMMGPRIQDLWMLLSGSVDEQEGQWQSLVRGYRQFHHIDESERELIEPLRGLRMIHHSAWIAQRWDDPAFPLAFPWFTSGRFWQEHLSDLWQQAELL